MRINIISLFPEMFSTLNAGILGKAIEKQQLTLQFWNPRDFAPLPYRRVDDRPYGGGPGMLMQVQPLRDAVLAAKVTAPQAKVINLSPQGKLLTQATLFALAQEPELILLVGRYEGIDERLVETYVDEEYSIGDYVLSGGELPAMVMIDALARLLPGVLGDPESAVQDSFSDGLLDCPHYTRPEEIDGKKVPKVLLSGDHEAIRRWRHQQSLGRTWLRRPDLLAKKNLTNEEKALLDEFIDTAKVRTDP